MYYLDNAATTQPYPEVAAEVQRIIENQFGNPSSSHKIGFQAHQLVEESREVLAGYFKVPKAGVIFCGSGTESDNLAIKGVLQKNGTFKGEFITSSLEHSAVLNTAKWLEQCGVKVHMVNINPKTGLVDLDHLAELVNDQTQLVSIQHVNNETGGIQDLAAISKVIKEKNSSVLFHSDGVQAFSKIPIDLKKLGVDLYSISAHKFRGIKGVGALITSKSLPLQPLVHGGGQEGGFRSGTENVIGIHAMGIAAKKAIAELKGNYQQVKTFSDWFRKELAEKASSIDVYQNDPALPHIISIAVPEIPGKVLLHHLAPKEIFVSTGSACNSNYKKMSPTLKALGFSQERIRETVRISLAAHALPKNREAFLDAFISQITELQEMVS